MEARDRLPAPGPAPVHGVGDATLSDVLGRLAEGVVVVDAAGRMLYPNAEAMRIMGFTSPEQVPVSLRDFESRFEVRDPDVELVQS